MERINNRSLLLWKLSFLFIFLFIGCNFEKKTIEKGLDLKQKKEIGLLKHVVLFKFKDDTTEEQIKSVESAFSGLPGKIPEIHAYEWGINNSPEGLNKGFTHCFYLTFKSEEDRAIYLPHPDHQAFVALASPFFEDVLVVDYFNK